MLGPVYFLQKMKKKLIIKIMTNYLLVKIDDGPQQGHFQGREGNSSGQRFYLGT